MPTAPLRWLVIVGVLFAGVVVAVQVISSDDATVADDPRLSSPAPFAPAPVDPSVHPKFDPDDLPPRIPEPDGFIRAGALLIYCPNIDRPPAVEGEPLRSFDIESLPRACR